MGIDRSTGRWLQARSEAGDVEILDWTLPYIHNLDHWHIGRYFCLLRKRWLPGSVDRVPNVQQLCVGLPGVLPRATLAVVYVLLDARQCATHCWQSVHAGRINRTVGDGSWLLEDHGALRYRGTGRIAWIVCIWPEFECCWGVRSLLHVNYCIILPFFFPLFLGGLFFFCHTEPPVYVYPEKKLHCNPSLICYLICAHYLQAYLKPILYLHGINFSLEQVPWSVGGRYGIQFWLERFCLGVLQRRDLFWYQQCRQIHSSSRCDALDVYRPGHASLQSVHYRKQRFVCRTLCRFLCWGCFWIVHLEKWIKTSLGNVHTLGWHFRLRLRDDFSDCLERLLYVRSIQGVRRRRICQVQFDEKLRNLESGETLSKKYFCNALTPFKKGGWGRRSRVFW